MSSNDLKTGFLLDGEYNHWYRNDENFIFFRAGNATSYIEIDTEESRVEIHGDNPVTAKISFATATDYDTGDGFYANGAGQVLIGSSSGYRVQFDGTDLTLSASNFSVENGNVSASNA